MEISIYVISIGAVLLFLPGAAWLGLSLIAIGLAVYYMTGKPPVASATGIPKRMRAYPMAAQYWPVPQAAQKRGAFSWKLRDLGGPLADSGMPGMRQGRGKPSIQDGTFNLPLPLSPEIAEFVDLEYKKPTTARNASFEKEKKNPFLPDF